MGGNDPAETTGKWVAAKFEHDSARPEDGYAAPQVHTHVVFFNLTQTEDGKTRAIQPRSLLEPLPIACWCTWTPSRPASSLSSR
jgi:conjugative relaxase-like TrwC/TraI family protein